MTQPVHAEGCPLCGGVLYTLELQENGPPRRPRDKPPLLQDAAGPYMVCPSCEKRVKMIEIQGPGGMTLVHPDPNQS